MIRRLYSDPAAPPAFSKLKNHHEAPKQTISKKTERKKSPGKIKAWLETQDAYTLHRPVTKRFPRNPYTVTNIGDVWEADIMDFYPLQKYDNYKYFLQVIDVSSEYLHSVPMRSKTGIVVTSAFKAILQDPKNSKPIRRRPIWVRTDKGKEFLNADFQGLLKREGIQFQICKNPDVKCSVVDRVNRTLCDKLFRYFTYKNTYRYLDVLPKFVQGYNATGHTTTGMAPAKVSDTDVLSIWNKMDEKTRRLKRLAEIKFRVEQTVRISKAKLKFAKGVEQNYTTEIFKIRKIICRTPRPVYELEDLRGQRTDGQFYTEELTPVRITKQTTY
jgi:transposase InsO family protein